MLDIDTGELDMPEDVPMLPDRTEFAREVASVLIRYTCIRIISHELCDYGSVVKNIFTIQAYSFLSSKVPLRDKSIKIFPRLPLD